MPTRLDRFAAHLSAKQTAALCLSGALIAASSFLAEMPAHGYRLHHSNAAVAVWTVATLCLWSVLFFLGFALEFFAYLRLQNGIAAARWSEDEIESLRTLLRSRAVTVCNIGLVVAFFALAILFSHTRPIGWACFLLSQSINLVANATRRQPSVTTQQPTWTNLAPIRSNHWGKR